MARNPAERLCRFVMREYGRRLTPAQIRGPWQHIGSASGDITGVIVPTDGDSPGFRVMLVDFEGRPSGFTTDSPPPLELA
jgi:hypothetical protein